LLCSETQLADSLVCNISRNILLLVEEQFNMTKTFSYQH